MIITDRFRSQLNELGVALSPDQEMQLDVYYKRLVDTNEKFNLTSITEEQEVLEKHFLDSLSIVKLVPQEELRHRTIRIIDVGTGAGFPGMVLAIAFPEAEVTLTDSLKKRLTFLEETSKELGLKNVRIVHARAEDLGRDPGYREQFDLCASRAVASLPVLCEYCLPFVRTKGLFAAYKGSNMEEELTAAEKAIELLGGELEKQVSFTLPQTEYERSLIGIRKIRKTPKTYPRKAGTPSKKPLG